MGGGRWGLCLFVKAFNVDWMRQGLVHLSALIC